MTSKTHDVFAFASLLTVAAYSPPPALNLTTAGVAVVGNIVGSLIPDLDQASNRLWDLLPGGNLINSKTPTILATNKLLHEKALKYFGSGYGGKY